MQMTVRTAGVGYVRGSLILLSLALAFMTGCAGIDGAVHTRTERGNEQVPGHIVKMVTFIQQKDRLVRENLPDCGRVYEAILGHIEDNLSELKEISETFHRIDSQGTQEEKFQAARQVMVHLGPIFTQTIEAQMAFAQKCPEESEHIRTVMRTVQKTTSPEQKDQELGVVEDPR